METRRRRRRQTRGPRADAPGSWRRASDARPRASARARRRPPPGRGGGRPRTPTFGASAFAERAGDGADDSGRRLHLEARAIGAPSERGRPAARAKLGDATGEARARASPLLASRAEHADENVQDYARTHEGNQAVRRPHRSRPAPPPRSAACFAMVKRPPVSLPRGFRPRVAARATHTHARAGAGSRRAPREPPNGARARAALGLLRRAHLRRWDARGRARDPDARLLLSPSRPFLCRDAPLPALPPSSTTPPFHLRPRPSS